MPIPPHRSAGDTGHVGDHNDLADQITANVAGITANASTLTAHTSGTDPHGDRTYADTTKAALVHSHSGMVVTDGSGKVPIAQIPTGTTSSTVSLGNHSHVLAPDWINVMNYGAMVDGATDDRAAVQAAIDANPGRTLYIPKGTGACMILSGALTNVTSNMRITGQIGASLQTSANGLFSLGTTAISAVEIDHLTMNVTGGDVFNGGRLSRCHFHDLLITQNSAAYAVWNAPNVTGIYECTWERITYTLPGASRTIPAWNFIMSSGNDLFNENVFEEIISNNNGPDSAQYQFFVDCSFAGGTYQNNTFRKITFENPLGGAIKVQSAQQTTIEQCRVWDLSTNPPASMFAITTNSTSGIGSSGTTIIASGRSFGPISGSSSYDVILDSSTSQTTIVNYSVTTGGSQKPYINLGGSSATTIVGLVSNAVIAGTSGASYTVIGQGVPSYTDTSGNAYQMSLPPAAPLASDQNLKAWTFDPVAALNTQILTAGQVYLWKVNLRSITTVTNIIIAVTTAGATLTANQCFAGLYNSSGTLLSATANQATNWQTAQLQTMALTSVQTNLAAGSYYIAVVSNGTTQPTLARGSGLTATMLNVGLTTGVGRFLQGPTGQTVLPSSITLGSQTLGPVSFWAALS